MSQLMNIKRGHLYDDQALQYFITKSKAAIEKCGLLIHRSDAIGPAGLIIEINKEF